jgi:fumarylpyruvate hydrolase
MAAATTSGYVLEPAVTAVPVAGTDGRLFPVRRVLCVGRNYAEHAREMGHHDREPPFFFNKAPDAVTSGPTIPYPSLTADLHHEVELVVALAREVAAEATAEQARAAIFGYAVGIDLTRRDLQAEAKKLARPWFLAKSFRGAAPIGPLVPAERSGHPRAGRIWLEVGGALRQEGDLAQMIWPVEEIMQELARYDRLLPGDLIFTGTPAGVGAVKPGDVLRAGAADLPPLEVEIVAAG